MIKIFCDKKEKDLVNFWNHMVFHPTNSIEDAWGQQHLDKLRGCDAHFSVIISGEDIQLYQRLGINVSCEPKYEVKKLYHK